MIIATHTHAYGVITMNAFDTSDLFARFGWFTAKFLSKPTLRHRRAFALGMRDDRRGNYENESYVNDGYESDAYWAGRRLSSDITRRGLAVTMELADIAIS